MVFFFFFFQEREGSAKIPNMTIEMFFGNIWSRAFFRKCTSVRLSSAPTLSPSLIKRARCAKPIAAHPCASSALFLWYTQPTIYSSAISGDHLQNWTCGTHTQNLHESLFFVNNTWSYSLWSPAMVGLCCINAGGTRVRAHLKMRRPQASRNDSGRYLFLLAASFE